MFTTDTSKSWTIFLTHMLLRPTTWRSGTLVLGCKILGHVHNVNWTWYMYMIHRYHIIRPGYVTQHVTQLKIKWGEYTLRNCCIWLYDYMSGNFVHAYGLTEEVLHACHLLHSNHPIFLFTQQQLWPLPLINLKSLWNEAVSRLFWPVLS